MTLTHFMNRCGTPGARNYLGARFSFLADSAGTGGSYGIVEAVVRHGLEPPPHTHTNEDEAYFVLDGEWTFRCGDSTTIATPGSFVFLPRGLQHTFRVTDDASRALIIFSPAGMERHFRDFSTPIEQPGPLPAPEFDELMRAVADVAEYGVTVPPPSGSMPPGAGVR